jgi:nucleotide-binding universal stress UspA family protein
MMQGTHESPGSGTASFRSILVATDLSDGSNEVLRVAAQVAARAAAPLHVVHAVDRLPGGLDEPYEERAREAERLLDALIGREVPSEVSVQRHVEQSSPDRAIMEWADRVDAGVIVVGPHVRRAGPARLLGTTAERVLGSARVPCLVVRAPLAVPSSHVVAAVDPAHGVEPVLDVAIQWALLFGGAGGSAGVSRLSVLHVTDDPRGGPPPVLEQAFRLALSRGDAGGRLTTTLAVRGTDVVESILLFAEAEVSDLLVLSTRNRGMVGRALLGSVSAEVTRRAPCNVLLIPPPPT